MDEIGFSITDESARFTVAFQRLQRGVRDGLIDPAQGTLQVQTRALIEYLIDRTPPKSLARARSRVRWFIGHIFNPVKEDALNNKRLANLVSRSSFAGWAKMAGSKNAGRFSGTIAVLPSKAIYDQFRNIGAKQYTNIRTLKRQQSALRDVIGAAVQNIGRGKSGWLMGLHVLGARDSRDWVERHGTDGGSFIDGVTGRSNASDWYYAGFNNTSWGKSPKADDVVTGALAARESAMDTYFKKQMELAGEGYATGLSAMIPAGLS